MALTPAPPNVDPAKLDTDFRYLLGAFTEVLRDLGEGDTAAALPWSGDDGSTWEKADEQSMVRAMSIALRLANMVEENAMAQHRRRLQVAYGPAAVSGTWGRVLSDVSREGHDAEEVTTLLSDIVVEPVLTAHPTEAKRATVLEQYRELYVLLVTRENQMWTPAERDEITTRVKAALERLWRTGDIFLERPGIADELRNVLHYLVKVFPRAVPRVENHLRGAWRAAGYDPAALDRADHPRLAFGTWVGGDRDGHPGVTADVTRDTLAELRENALDLVDERLGDLGRRLSISDLLETPPTSLSSWIEESAAKLGEAGAHAVARNQEEPWRQAVNLMRVRLPSSGAGIEFAYGDPGELIDDLDRLRDSLDEIGASRMASVDLDPVVSVVRTFGFHLAGLDIRQNSAFHDRALAQLLEAAGIDGGADFPTWDEERRLALLDVELRSRRPLVRPDVELGHEATAVLGCYRVLADEIRAHGTAGVGALIVSMTRSLSDLLVVYLLAEEAGLVEETADGARCLLPVVPLFETIDDLEASPVILRSFLQHPMTRATLEGAAGGGRPVQQVMVGYSDSNKDGGIVASLWGLHRAQEKLSAVGAVAGVRIQFFHGRGGTISRGAGPTHRFLRALPPGSLEGTIRVTEQGETISQHYANLITAEYHLELLLAGTLGTTIGRKVTTEPHELEPAMDRLAESSRKAYADLLRTDGFIPFFRRATPIDVIEGSSIGSRPSRRTGQATIADLRAIPWVFAWSQSRFFLSGWYGLGTALDELKSADPELHAAVFSEVADWPALHYIVSNAATSVAMSDVEVMRLYAGLVEDGDLRDTFLDRILEERERTVASLEEIYGGPLESRRINVERTLDLRRPALRRLHETQVARIREWRADGGDDPEQLRRLLMIVNAIASGLGSTG